MTEGCEGAGGPAMSTANRGSVRRQIYRCAVDPAGSALRIRYPLFNPSVSALVRISRLSGEKHSLLASPEQTEVIIPEDSSHRRVEISARLGTWDILEPFVTATKIINVPVAKSHNLMQSSAGMKNWIGITNKLRVMFHNDIHQSVAELAALMRPTLTVVDATRVLMHGGPDGGSIGAVNPYGAIAAGFDPVALDAWACSIFDPAAVAPPEYLRIAESMGLGTADFRSLQPIEVIASS